MEVSNSDYWCCFVICISLCLSNKWWTLNGRDFVSLNKLFIRNYSSASLWKSRNITQLFRGFDDHQWCVQLNQPTTGQNPLTCAIISGTLDVQWPQSFSMFTESNWTIELSKWAPDHLHEKLVIVRTNHYPGVRQHARHVDASTKVSEQGCYSIDSTLQCHRVMDRYRLNRGHQWWPEKPWNRCIVFCNFHQLAFVYFMIGSLLNKYSNFKSVVSLYKLLYRWEKWHVAR